MNVLQALRASRIQTPRYEGEAETAHHEAGHAVVAHSLGIPIEFATVMPSDVDESAGLCRLRDRPFLARFLDEQSEFTDSQRKRAERELVSHAIVSLAGPMAHARFRGSPPDEVAGSADIAAALELAIRLAGSSEQASALLTEWTIQANKIVEERWSEVTALATELQRERVLSGHQIRQVLRGPGAPKAPAREAGSA